MWKNFKVIDADAHTHEPQYLWQRYVEPKYRDQVPKVAFMVYEPDGKFVLGAIKNSKPSRSGQNDCPQQAARIPTIFRTTFLKPSPPNVFIRGPDPDSPVVSSVEPPLKGGNDELRIGDFGCSSVRVIQFDRSLSILYSLRSRRCL
jgi:hypothetical protein